MCSQCCGSGMFIPDPTFFHPGSELFPSRIPDPHQFKYFNPEKWFLSSRKYDPDPDFLPIPDPGSRGQKGTDPGSGSATLCVASYSSSVSLYDFDPL
jgi:hypothetical protein